MRGPSEKMWPEINLAPQVLINEDGGGTCNGGNAPGVMRYIEKNGIPDETCQAYQAKNDPHGKESDLNICENCVQLHHNYVHRIATIQIRAETRTTRNHQFPRYYMKQNQ